MNDLTDTYGCHKCGFMECTCMAPHEDIQKLLEEWEQHIMIGGDSPWTNAKKMKTCQSILSYIHSLQSQSTSLPDQHEDREIQKLLKAFGMSPPSMRWSTGQVSEDIIPISPSIRDTILGYIRSLESRNTTLSKAAEEALLLRHDKKKLEADNKRMQEDIDSAIAICGGLDNSDKLKNFLTDTLSSLKASPQIL